MTEQNGVVQELAEWPAMGFYGNVFIREIDLPYKGMVLPGHKHDHDHATFIGKGRIQVKWTSPTDGSVKLRMCTAPDWLEVPAHADHEMTAMTNGCKAFCVFAARDEQGEVVEFVKETHVQQMLKSQGKSKIYGG